MRVAFLLAACAALSCGRDAPGGEGQASFDVTARPVAGGAESAAGASRAPECPHTGRWSRCAILERLDRAGLAPQLDSSAMPDEPPLTAPGMLVRVARAEAEIYLYEDASARRRDEARLERARYLDYAEPVSMQTIPTLIVNSNAIVVLHSRNDHQRERVGDAITAGPPPPPDRRP